MINEFHLGLLNELASNTLPGSDYVPQSWRPRKQSRSAATVRTTLSLQNVAPETANWRSVEIRKLLDKVDFQDVLSQFDLRSGYSLDDLHSEMVEWFRPKITAEQGGEAIQVWPQPYAPGFVIKRWSLEIEAERVTIQDDHGRSVLIDTDPQQAVLSLPLPGTESRITLPAVAPNRVTVQWAAMPSKTLADAASLLGEVRNSLSSLAGERNVLPIADCELLRDIAIHHSEASAKVIAAATLLVGATLASPEVAA